MKIGAHLLAHSSAATRDSIAGIATTAEALGYDTVWVSDHIAIPSRISSVYPYGGPGSFNPDAVQNVFEAYGVLCYVAGITKRVELGTSAIVLPQRQPLLVAKQWATLDALSGGRAILGIGAGWLEEEFEALQMSRYFAPRGKATDESIEIFRKAWTTQGDVSYEGEVYQFHGIRMLPKPVRPSGLPIWIGGHGKRAIRRVAEHGNGWLLLRMPLAELKASMPYLHAQLEKVGRRPEDVTISMGLPIWAPGKAPSEPSEFDVYGDPDQAAGVLRGFVEAGVSHFLLSAARGTEGAAMQEALEFVAEEVRPRV